MENAFPGRGGVRSRPGFTQHCATGESTPVGSLIEYEFGTANKLLACVNGKIFETSTSTPTSLKTGLDTDAIYFVHSTLNSKQFLTNGVDTLQVYDGSTIADATFTGLTLSDINYVHTHKSRIYAIKKDTQEIWYGGVGAVTGTLSKFDLGLTGTFGGSLKLVTSISRDGGAGPDDFIVFIFESGDAVVYAGSDPGDADNWSRVGVFKIGRPLSRRGVLQIDSEVVVVTDRGYEPLSRVLPFGSATNRANLLSDKINPAVLTAIGVKGAADDWQVSLYGRGEMLIVNVPFSASRSEQHIMNIDTGAWCKWTMPAGSWGRLGSDMYFGDNTGKVHKFDSANNDNGALIGMDVQQAYNYLGNRSQLKKLNMLRPIFITSILPPLRLNVGADFETVSRGQTRTVGTGGETYVWDDAGSVWNDATWSPERAAFDQIYRENALGYCMSPRLSLDVSRDSVSWTSTTFIFEPGGLIR